MNDSIHAAGECIVAQSLKPRCALEVAVAGNRRFGGETELVATPAAERMKDQARIACITVWKAIRSAMVSALEISVIIAPKYFPHGSKLPDGCLRDYFCGGQSPRLGVLSSLAAGADQIGAETALDCADKTGVTVELEAVFPFGEMDYPGTTDAQRPEFKKEEAEKLRQLSEKACQVTRLDGRYGAADECHRAYRQVRDVLLQNADLLVAIYDPYAKGGTAGTRETVAAALSSGLSVVAVLLAEHEARIAIYQAPNDIPNDPSKEWEDASPYKDVVWRKELERQVHYLLSIPHLIPAFGETPGSQDGNERLQNLAVTVERLRVFYGEDPIHWTCLCPVRRALFAGAWKMILRVGQTFAQRHNFANQSEKPAHEENDVTIEPYATFYRRASQVSEAYMRTYRGSFVLAFLLAGVAVAAAVALMAVSLLADGKPPLWLIAPLGIFKITVLLTLLWLEHAGRHERHQEHAADFRYLAELLRPMQWLAPLGTSVPAVGLPPHYAPLDPRQGWTQWLFRAIGRSTPSVAAASTAFPTHVDLTKSTAKSILDQAKNTWIPHQIHYHWSNAINMHAIENGLERMAKQLLWIVLGSAAIALAIELLLHRKIITDQAYTPKSAILLGALAAALPAFIAAFGGIMFQSEAKRLRIRSEAMYRGLVLQQKSLSLPLESQGGVAWQTAQRLRALAGVMIGETGDWKALYQLHEVRAG